MNINQYLSGVFHKYKLIAKTNNEPDAHIQQSLGDNLGIKSGKVKKQIPAKLMNKEFNHKGFRLRGDEQ